MNGCGRLPCSFADAVCGFPCWREQLERGTRPMGLLDTLDQCLNDGRFSSTRGTRKHTDRPHKDPLANLYLSPNRLVILLRVPFRKRTRFAVQVVVPVALGQGHFEANILTPGQSPNLFFNASLGFIHSIEIEVLTSILFTKRQCSGKFVFLDFELALRELVSFPFGEKAQLVVERMNDR